MEKLYDLFKRILGVVLILPPFALAFWLGGIYFKLAIFIAIIILYYEIYRLVVNRFSLLSFFVGLFAIGLAFWEGGFILSFILLFIFGIVNYLWGFSVKEAIILLAVAVYILVPANIIITLREFSFELCLFVLAVNWSFDTGAYLFGKFSGRRKIFTRISSGKTLEGLLGGLLTSAIVGGILGYAFWGFDRLPFYTLSGIYIGVFAQLGDLVESALKREKGVKDSGKIMPGHGGLFDRVDSLIMSLVGFFLLFRFFGYIYS